MLQVIQARRKIGIVQIRGPRRSWTIDFQPRLCISWPENHVLGKKSWVSHPWTHDCSVPSGFTSWNSLPGALSQAKYPHQLEFWEWGPSHPFLSPHSVLYMPCAKHSLQDFLKQLLLTRVLHNSCVQTQHLMAGGVNHYTKRALENNPRDHPNKGRMWPV